MNITVLCGSPKGELSVTYQYVRFLRQEFPEHSFDFYHPAQKIKALAKNSEEWDKIMNAIRNTDLVLWAFPLYVLLVHAGLKQFIENIFDRKELKAFEGKYASALSTSIHFFDHTAHEYIRGISEDLGMRYAGFHSAKMNDLLKKEGQKKLKGFFNSCIETVKRKDVLQRETAPIKEYSWKYIPADHSDPVKTKKRVLILADALTGNAGTMVSRLAAGIEGQIDIAVLQDTGIKGGCMGCLNCGDKNICSYQDKDGFIDFFNSRIKPADVIIFAGTMKDRYLSWQWKQYFDRSFFNTHQRTLNGKHFGLMVSGPLSQADVLKETFKAFVEWQGSTLSGMISDESGSSEFLDRAIDGFTKNLLYQAEHEIKNPETFLGVGGMKIFRDDIYENLKIVFRADHRDYRKKGVYDYIQKKPLKRMLFSLADMIIGIPPIKNQMRKYMKQGMIQPFRKLFRQSSR